MEIMTEKSDHLDKETTLSVAITDNSIKVGSTSRFVAAIDRLGGSVIDTASAALESFSERRRAKTKGEVQLIEAITEYGITQLGANPTTAERAFRRHFSKVMSQQENIDHVLLEAKADLELNPPSADDPDQTEELSEEFMNRFEEYSATATTDDLRQRWGRVLASEVRKPGTFSGKVLRVIDEMNTETAQVFEEVCKSRIRNLVLKCVCGVLPYPTIASLTTAGLILEAGLGQTYGLEEFESSDTGKIWGFHTEWGLIALPINVTSRERYQEAGCLQLENGKPRVPVYVLTDVGVAIASILPDNQSEAFEKYAHILEKGAVAEWVRFYKPSGIESYTLIWESKLVPR
jgi:hypothetical protein